MHFKYFAFDTCTTEYLRVERELLEMDSGINVVSFNIKGCGNGNWQCLNRYRFRNTHQITLKIGTNMPQY